MEHINQVTFQKISKVQEHMASASRLASRLANLLTTKAVSRLATPKQVGQYEIRWPRNLKRSMHTTWRKKNGILDMKISTLQNAHWINQKSM